MTAPLDLDAIEKRAAAATPGPWFIVYRAIHSSPLNEEYHRIEKTIPDDAPEEAYEVLPETAVAWVPVVAGDTPTRQGGIDGDFIAAARADVPLLVARVRELEAARDLKERFLAVGVEENQRHGARNHKVMSLLGIPFGSNEGTVEGTERVLAELARLRAEIAAMRPVVDAAVNLEDNWVLVNMDDDPLYRADARRLVEAIGKAPAWVKEARP